MNFNLNLKKVKVAIIGVSGGIDSMVLVHAIKQQFSSIKLICAHIDHGIRKNSHLDAEFVKQEMKKLGLSTHILRLEAPKTGNIEEWGRNSRYEFFNQLAEQEKADSIITAHHQNDDFESFLLHFARGTRIKGMSGILEQNGKILRPLLYTNKEQIKNYAKLYKIQYREDETNSDQALSRNFLRLNVVPNLLKLDGDLIEKWQSQKTYWLELQKWVESESELFLQKNLSEKGLLKSEYKKLALPLRLTILEKWYINSTGQRIEKFASLNRWDKFINELPSGKKTDWHKNIFLEINKTHALLKLKA